MIVSKLASLGGALRRFLNAALSYVRPVWRADVFSGTTYIASFCTRCDAVVPQEAGSCPECASRFQGRLRTTPKEHGIED